MPELPEVETVRQALLVSVKNRVFANAFIYHKNIVEGDEKKFIQSLKNKKILDIKRHGKFLIFKLSERKIMLAHLGMEGKMIPGRNAQEKTKYVRVLFLFKDGTILNFDDSRCFGYLAIRDDTNYDKILPLSKVGIDANDPKINLDEIYSLIHASSRTIKDTLLDQSIIAGLGNIYVDETLFLSRISPLSRANLLNKSDVKTILLNAKKLLNLAIKNHGTTVSTFYWAKGHTGGFQKYLKVYGHKDDKCENCGTSLVKIKIGGRGTTYCPKCQKLKSDHYILGITGPIGSGKTTALDMLSDLGYCIYSSDATVDKLYRSSTFKKELKRLFNCTTKNEIKALIKKQPQQLAKLEKLIHPLIKKDIINYIKAHPYNRIAIEVPLLFESGFNQLMDETLFITSSKCQAHLKKRQEKNKDIVAVNQSLKHRSNAKKATYVIVNDGSLSDLLKQIKQIAK